MGHPLFFKLIPICLLQVTNQHPGTFGTLYLDENNRLPNIPISTGGYAPRHFGVDSEMQ
jgi:hypothetical protein